MRGKPRLVGAANGDLVLMLHTTLFNTIFPSGKLSLANAPQALRILTLKRMANTFAIGHLLQR